MSGIDSLLSLGGYYSLFDSHSPGTPATPPDPADALLNASSLWGGSASDQNSSDAFLLDLSPQAQQILDAMKAGTGASAAPGLSLNNFTLGDDQQKTITRILAKYKDAPYTQDTFNQIQNDLQAAGLSPSILSMQDQVKSFDPALVLLDALNGTTTDMQSLTGTTADNEQAKNSDYMQQIIKQWQSISTTYSTTVAAADGSSSA